MFHHVSLPPINKMFTSNLFSLSCAFVMLTHPDNPTSSITKRASPVEKTLLEVCLIMHKR